MERKTIPGVSVAVIKDGKPVVVKGYGLANIEHNVPVRPETIFQSGSVGKQFTAFAIMCWSMRERSAWTTRSASISAKCRNLGRMLPSDIC